MMFNKKAKFTIHFATINTIEKRAIQHPQYKFTIHFATINTSYNYTDFLPFQGFTIHFATINTVNLIVTETLLK